jgi:hypothetical protein
MFFFARKNGRKRRTGKGKRGGQLPGYNWKIIDEY